MGDDHPLRVGGRSGGEDDFGHVVARQFGGGGGRAGPIELLQRPCRAVDRRAQRRNVVPDQNHLGAHDAADTCEEVGRRSVVDRDDDGADEQTSPERDDPFGAVLAPEHHGVAFGDTAVAQPRGKSAGGPADVGVGVGVAAETVVVDEKIPACACEIVEKVNERGAGHD